MIRIKYPKMFQIFSLQNIKKLFFENYTEAVMNNAKRLHSFPDTETDLATEEIIRENS